MKQPPIEMRWGGGKWPSGFKRAARPWVQNAIELTEGTLDHLGVRYQEEKTVTVWCVGKNWDDGVATAEDTGDIELYLPYPMLKYRKVGRHAAALTLSVVHEVAHCVRAEAVPQNNLLERVVTEGVAITAARLLSRELFTAEEIQEHAGKFTGSIDPGVEAILLDHLMNDAAREAYLEEAQKPGYEDKVEDIYRAWFDGNDPTTLGAGSILGLTAVGRLLDVGVPYPEIVTLPTEDILTLPTELAA